MTKSETGMVTNDGCPVSSNDSMTFSQIILCKKNLLLPQGRFLFNVVYSNRYLPNDRKENCLFCTIFHNKNMRDIPVLIFLTLWHIMSSYAVR